MVDRRAARGEARRGVNAGQHDRRAIRIRDHRVERRRCVGPDVDQAAVGRAELQRGPFANEILVVGLELVAANWCLIGACLALADVHKHHVVVGRGGGLCLLQRGEGVFPGAVAGRQGVRRVVNVEDLVGQAGLLVDRLHRRLVGPHDVLVSHHRLLHLVGHVAAARPAHAVGQPREARPVEEAVVVGLEREIPVADQRQIHAGVHTAEVRD